MTPRRERTALLLALAAVALWSTVAVAFKTALRELRPVDLLAQASLVSWAALGAVLAVRRIVHGRREAVPVPSGGTDRKSRLAAVLLGLLNPLLYYLVLFAAYDRLPAQAAQPLNYTWPLFLALLAAPINGRRPASRDLVAIFISFAGVILISWRPTGGSAALDGFGVVLALGSGVIWALYWLIGNRLEMDGGVRLFHGFSLAAAILAVLWALRGFPRPGTAAGWGAVCWVGLFEMGITFLFWNGALERTANPARIGNLVYLGPFVSLVWIRLILDERIRPATVAGLTIIVLGILYGQGVMARLRRGEPH